MKDEYMMVNERGGFRRKVFGVIFESLKLYLIYHIYYSIRNT